MTDNQGRDDRQKGVDRGGEEKNDRPRSRRIDDRGAAQGWVWVVGYPSIISGGTPEVRTSMGLPGLSRARSQASMFSW